MPMTTAVEPRLDVRAPVWGESRVLLEAGRALWPLLCPPAALKATRPRHLLVLPGFGADDAATWPLRRFLQKLGHHVEGWGLGRNRAGLDIRHAKSDLPPGWVDEPIPRYRNEGSVPMLCERMRVRAEQRQRELGAPLTLIGWSLGGVVAREVARDLPDAVEEVITLGTPVQGGPKYTRAAAFFKDRGMDLDLIERSVRRRDARPIRAPITAIVSPSDAIVAHAATFDRHNPNVRHLEVDGSHLGMCVNPTVWRRVAETLNRRP
jgi:pimeloyl-ACP methyl ester carboxylesterase